MGTGTLSSAKPKLVNLFHTFMNQKKDSATTLEMDSKIYMTQLCLMTSAKED